MTAGGTQTLDSRCQKGRAGDGAARECWESFEIFNGILIMEMLKKFPVPRSQLVRHV